MNNTRLINGERVSISDTKMKEMKQDSQDYTLFNMSKIAAKQERDKALMSCTVEVNGNVYQTRPSDEANFRLRIAGLEAGAKANWLLENDTSVSATREELETVYASGLAKIGGIWDEYILALDAL